MLGLAPPVFKVAPEFCLTPKIQLAPGLKGQTHTKSSLVVFSVMNPTCLKCAKNKVNTKRCRLFQ